MASASSGFSICQNAHDGGFPVLLGDPAFRVTVSAEIANL